jgi:hypothetical protein
MSLSGLGFLRNEVHNLEEEIYAQQWLGVIGWIYLTLSPLH